MESLFINLFLAGVLLLGFGSIWMLLAAARVRWSWCLGLLLCPPLVLLFLYRHQRVAAWPAACLACGLVCLLFPAAWTRLVPVDLGPYERIVDGELHLTLTGWDRTDYRVLSQRMNVAVLQMANSDVNNATLTLLQGMPLLKELDISHSQVTDMGLAALEGLPLEVLRINGCQITDQGFREHLMTHATLRMVDLRGTKVSSAIVREWRQQDRSRRALLDPTAPRSTAEDAPADTSDTPGSSAPAAPSADSPLELDPVQEAQPSPQGAISPADRHPVGSNVASCLQLFFTEGVSLSASKFGDTMQVSWLSLPSTQFVGSYQRNAFADSRQLSRKFVTLPAERV